jgi:hypothetical protein
MERDSQISNKIKQAFMNANLVNGRAITQGKTFYWEKFPNNVTCFNANVISSKHGKIWWGDLDLTLDGMKLEQVARELNEDLYVLQHLDAGFEKENLSGEELKKKAIWSTKIFN